MGFKRVGWDVVDWLCVAQDGNQWRTLVNTVRSLGVK